MYICIYTYAYIYIYIYIYLCIDFVYLFRTVLYKYLTKIHSSNISYI